MGEKKWDFSDCEHACWCQTGRSEYLTNWSDLQGLQWLTKDNGQEWSKRLKIAIATISLLWNNNYIQRLITGDFKTTKLCNSVRWYGSVTDLKASIHPELCSAVQAAAGGVIVFGMLPLFGYLVSNRQLNSWVWVSFCSVALPILNNSSTQSAGWRSLISDHHKLLSWTWQLIALTCSPHSPNISVQSSNFQMWFHGRLVSWLATWQICMNKVMLSGQSTMWWGNSIWQIWQILKYFFRIIKNKYFSYFLHLSNLA